MFADDFGGIPYNKSAIFASNVGMEVLRKVLVEQKLPYEIRTLYGADEKVRGYKVTWYK